MSDVDPERLAAHPHLMAALAEMFAANRRHRGDRAATAFRTLRRYERRIVKEAAAMAYVLGYQNGNLDGRTGSSGPANNGNPIPPDFEILQLVIEHCDSTSDNFPFLAAACDGRRRRVTKTQLYHFERAETAS